jgi:septal ring factor EnvC (AmiA/AmiB activator)
MLTYTPQQLSAFSGISSRHITDLCNQGAFKGAYKSRARWRIPQDAAMAWLAEREAEVVPPEEGALAPHDGNSRAAEFILSVVAEPLKRNSEEIEKLKESLQRSKEEEENLKKKVAELEERLASEAQRNSEEVAELLGKTEQLEDHDRKFMEGLREVQRQLEKKPGLVARVVKRLFG